MYNYFYDTLTFNYEWKHKLDLSIEFLLVAPMPVTFIYTTIAALSAKIYPQNLAIFFSTRALPIRQRSSRTFFLRLHLANPRPLCDRFLRLSFVFLTTNNHRKKHRCDESVSIGVIDQLRSANDDPNALLHINR